LQEKELILRAQRGDNLAWADLVRLHQQAVFRLAYLHLADAAEAEDAAQDCMIRAFRGLRRFDVERPLRPWLLRIVSNLARNRRRSAGRYWAALQRAALQQPQIVAGADGESERLEEREDLWRAVRQLPTAMQNVLYLRFFLELSVEESGQVLEVAEGTVKSQTHRALGQLQKIIRAQYPELEEAVR
jgi:RNA polymerase sigma factor (sigma-70 family)